MERATGVEPATSSLGTITSREIRGKTETKRAKFLHFPDRREPCSDPIFRQFPAECPEISPEKKGADVQPGVMDVETPAIGSSVSDVQRGTKDLTTSHGAPPLARELSEWIFHFISVYQRSSRSGSRIFRQT